MNIRMMGFSGPSDCILSDSGVKLCHNSIDFDLPLHCFLPRFKGI